MTSKSTSAAKAAKPAVAEGPALAVVAEALAPATLPPALRGRSAKRTKAQDAELALIMAGLRAEAVGRGAKKPDSKVAQRLNSDSSWIQGQAYWTGAEVAAVLKRS